MLFFFRIRKCTKSWTTLILSLYYFFVLYIRAYLKSKHLVCTQQAFQFRSKYVNTKCKNDFCYGFYLNYFLCGLREERFDVEVCVLKQYFGTFHMQCYSVLLCFWGCIPRVHYVLRSERVNHSVENDRSC